MRKLSVFITTVIALLFLAPSTFAAAATTPLIACDKLAAPFNTLCTITTDPETALPQFIAKAISFIFVIGVVIAIFFLLLGAVKWIYSGGDKAAIESARGTITSAVIGLVILFLVFLVFTVILKFFGIDIINIELPSINAV